MSPSLCHFVHGDTGFPRVSGDEPLELIAKLEFALFSPRERG